MFSFTKRERKLFRSILRGRETWSREFIYSNNLEVIKWLREIGKESCFTTYYILSFGKLEILKWLVESRKFSQQYYDPSMLRLAVRFGHMDIIHYLRNKGFQWDSSVFLEAVLTEQLEILKWLIKNECPTPPRNRITEMTGGSQPEMIQLLKEYGFI